MRFGRAPGHHFQSPVRSTLDYEGRVGGRTPQPIDLSYLSFVGCFDTHPLDAWPREPGLADYKKSISKFDRFRDALLEGSGAPLPIPSAFACIQLWGGVPGGVPPSLSGINPPAKKAFRVIRPVDKSLVWKRDMAILRIIYKKPTRLHDFMMIL